MRLSRSHRLAPAFVPGFSFLETIVAVELRQMAKLKVLLPNITAPKASFDALLGKLLRTPPLPRADIPKTAGRRRSKTDQPKVDRKPPSRGR